MIPKEIREKAGLKVGSEAVVDLRGNEVVIKKASPASGTYLEYYKATIGKKLDKEVDIRAILEGEKNERTRLR